MAVTDGAVTLTGHVPTYAEKLALARAAERVYGVKAVGSEVFSVNGLAILVGFCLGGRHG